MDEPCLCPSVCLRTLCPSGISFLVTASSNHGSTSRTLLKYCCRDRVFIAVYCRLCDTMSINMSNIHSPLSFFLIAVRHRHAPAVDYDRVNTFSPDPRDEVLQLGQRVRHFSPAHHRVGRFPRCSSRWVLAFHVELLALKTEAVSTFVSILFCDTVLIHVLVIKTMRKERHQFLPPCIKRRMRAALRMNSPAVSCMTVDKIP